jgi:hypothetical protein
MELESLKYIWHSLEAPPVAEQERQALLALLERRSRGPVARMRRNLVGEAIMLLVAYVPAILCFLLAFEGRLAPIAWLFALLAIGFFAYYYRKYRLLVKMECPGCHVKANLERQVATLKKYTGFYLIAGTLMVPLVYLIAWLIIRWRIPATGPALGAALYYRLHPVPWWAGTGFWLSMLIPLTVGIYFANAWYINKRYGRHIKKLQDLLREMESE